MIIVDSKSSIPIYEQIQSSVKELIIRDGIKANEKLPSIRELSSLLMLNHNTVSKAYSQLEKNNIIETLKGKGTFVTQDAKFIINEEYTKLFKDEVLELVKKAIVLNINYEELVGFEKDIYSNFEEGFYARS